MMRYLDGKLLSETILARLKHRVSRLRRKPGLAIILVGNDEGSRIYVRRKVAAAERIGVRASVFRFTKNVKAATLLRLIRRLNRSHTIDGMIVQLPLPEHLDEDRIVLAISPRKDADGFHPSNLAAYLARRPGSRMPGVIRGILLLIKETRRRLSRKHAVILANSRIFADPLATALERLGLTVARIAPPFRNFAPQTRKADLLVCAVGRPHFVDANLVKPGSILIDVGFNRRRGEIVGDVDAKSVQKKAAWLTPVPGGVGPMTVAMLLERVVELREGHVRS